MKVTKIVRKDMEVAIVGNQMIGKSKGPIKAILPSFEERLSFTKNVKEETQKEIKVNVEKPVDNVKKVAVKTQREAFVGEDVLRPLTNKSINEKIEKYSGIDMEDYMLFAKWMIENGGKPSIEEYKKAINYYSNK